MADEVNSNQNNNSNRIGLVLGLVNLLVTFAMAGVLFVSFQRDRRQPTVQDIVANHQEDPAQEVKKKPVEFGKMITLDQFTVNLSTAGTVNPKYVRVNISVEVPDEDSEREVNAKMPQVRNVIIDLFNSKRPVDLSTGEGRDYVKEEIKGALNSVMNVGKIKGVFFTNFAVSG
jgi:flagellar basal body-associated protein FliL